MKKKWAILYYMVVPDELIKPYVTFINKLCTLLTQVNDQQKEGIAIGFYIYKLYFERSTNLPIYAGVKYFPGPAQLTDQNFFKLENGTIIPSEPGDISSLESFFEEAKQQFNADKYFIRFWGHGGGYFAFSSHEKFNFISTIGRFFYLESSSIKDVIEVFISQQEKFSSPLNAILETKKNFSEKGKDLMALFIEDETQKLIKDPEQPVVFMHRKPKFPDTITMLAAEEISAALLHSGFNKETTFIEFSSCLMQNIETAYQLSKCCAYLVTSQDYLYPVDITNCYELTSILNDSLSPSDVCYNIVEEYKKASPDPNPTEQCRCISALETGKIRSVETLLKGITETALSNADYFALIIKNARAACSNFADDENGNTTDDLKLDLIDFIWFFKCLERQLHLHIHLSAPSYLIPFLFNVQELISQSEKAVLNKLVKANRSIDLNAAWSYGGHGFNISFPKDLKRAEEIAPVFLSIFYSRSINKLDFFTDIRWMEFVKLAYR